MSVHGFIFSDLIVVLSIAFTVKMLESILNMKGVLLLDTIHTSTMSEYVNVRYRLSIVSYTFIKYMLIRSLSHEEKSSRRIINEGYCS